jgi:uncharacterized protein (TIGR02118 family)
MVQHFLVVLWRPADVSGEQFAVAVDGRARELAIGDLAFNVVDGPRSPISRKRADGARIGGLVSFAAAGADAAVALSIAGRLDPGGAHHAVYAVDRAVPVEYERTWPTGTPSPGVKQVTFLTRRPGMTDDEFITYWHGTHTPLAIEIHPLWRYVRSVVVAPLTPGAPRYEGIVELHFRSAEDITDTLRFYGGKPENQARIAADVRNFIDFDTIDIAHMRETVLAEEQSC